MNIRILLIILLSILFSFVNLEVNFLFAQENPLKKAMSLFKKGKYEKSKALFKKLTKKHPDNGLIWFNLGNVYFTLNELTRAISAYKKVIELNSPLGIPAKLYIAKSYRKDAYFKRSLKILLPLKNRKMPPNILDAIELEIEAVEIDALEQAANLYQKEQYEASLEIIDFPQLLKISPDALMLKGLCLLRLGDKNRAIKVFKRISNMKDDKGNRKEARKLLKEIRKKSIQEEKDIWLDIELSGGYAYNLYGDGIRCEENGTCTEIPGYNTIVGTSISLGGYLSQSTNFSSKLGFLVAWNEVVGKPNNKFINNQIYTEFLYDKINFSLEITPKFKYQMFGQSTLLYSAGSSIELLKKNEILDFGINYEFLRNRPLESNYDYIDGHTHKAKLFLNLYTESFFVSLSYMYIIEKMDDLETSTVRLPLAYKAHGPGLGVAIIPGNSWLIKTMGQLLFKEYDNTYRPGDEKRVDINSQVLSRLTYKISNNFRIFISESMLFNRSNMNELSEIDNKNYNQFITEAGLMWSLW